MTVARAVVPPPGALAKPNMCWPERNIAIRNAARAYLTETCGFVVQRKSIADLVPEWSVSQFSGWFSNKELIQLATEYGFRPEAVKL